jgi:hypothetical protein
MSQSLHPLPNASIEVDLPLHLASLLAGTGVSPPDTGGAITFEGRDPLFPSAAPLASAFALSAMAAAVGAAAIWRMRTKQGQDLSIDLRKAAHGINPEFTFHPKPEPTQMRQICVFVVRDETVGQITGFLIWRLISQIQPDSFAAIVIIHASTQFDQNSPRHGGQSLADSVPPSTRREARPRTRPAGKRPSENPTDGNE